MIASVVEWLVPAIPLGVFIVTVAYVAVRTLQREIREVRAEVRHQIGGLKRSLPSEIRSGTSTIRKELEQQREQRWGLIREMRRPMLEAEPEEAQTEEPETEEPEAS